MYKRQQLETAIAELETQWDMLSEEVINTSIAGLQEQMAELQAPEQQRLPQTVTDSLEQAIHACQNNNPVVANKKLEHALALTEEINQL